MSPIKLLDWRGHLISAYPVSFPPLSMGLFQWLLQPPQSPSECCLQSPQTSSKMRGGFSKEAVVDINGAADINVFFQNNVCISIGLFSVSKQSVIPSCKQLISI